KIVNSLTACSEIGGPMAAMYLLKHPDHYKSHKFRTCFWRGYVYEVMHAWEDSAKIAEEGTTKVMLGLSGTSKRIIALSPVQDYIWRPTEYEHMSLYDWVRLADKQRIKHGKKGPKKSEEHIDEPGAGANEEEESEDELLLTKTSNQELEADSAPKPKKSRSKYVQFHENHPQYNTHHVKLLDESEAYVPNFICGSLPRRDAGNLEQYCMTMLTLFKPWRTGQDLRPSQDVLWDDVFNGHSFTERQLEVMKFFHIKYECNDARDDLFAARKKGKTGPSPFNMDNATLDDLDTQYYNDDGELNISEIEEMVLRTNDWTELSNAEISRRTQMLQAEQIIQASGWLDPMKEKNSSELPSKFNSKEDMSSADWKNVLAAKRQEILDARDAQAALKKPANASTHPVNDEVNKVKVVDRSYYMSKAFKAQDQEAQALIDTTATYTKCIL
ncbi:uncharacterized protein TRAVEDRAFT_114867, partial [Trametes versicolor FP-101664 SS1]|uniref:uncharacterized protein n=1 Tax=Trametes versicolor (strain FP-101664) TaxID=717944 RepID=UPI0004621D75